MHGCSGAHTRGALLRACIFNEPGVFPAPDGWNLMRFLNGSCGTALEIYRASDAWLGDACNCVSL
jgi:hypothetical protein